MQKTHANISKAVKNLGRAEVELLALDCPFTTVPGMGAAPDVSVSKSMTLCPPRAAVDVVPSPQSMITVCARETLRACGV